MLNYLYDDLERVVGVRYSDSTTSARSYSHNGGGGLSSVHDGLSETLEFLYDESGNSVASYTYDAETELYYLQSRYYDPGTGRFIKADEYASSGQDYVGYNMFAYCGNNPVVRTDVGGGSFDTIFDVVSLCFSVAEVIANPADPWAWAGLAGDVVDLVQFVSGVGNDITNLTRTGNIPSWDAVSQRYWKNIAH